MLVYANHLCLQGPAAKELAFKAIGAWLKEQLGFGLHPNQLLRDGEFEGTRGDIPCRLRINATTEEKPELYSWVLKFRDATVHGRHWIVEVGLKVSFKVLDLSCIVKTDEYSTMVASPVTASQPRLIRYIASNVLKAKDVDFAAAVPGIDVKKVGRNEILTAP